MARHVPVGATISAAALMDYRSLLAREQLHYLGHVAAFLKFWVARGYAGVDRDVLQFFSSIKIPGNVKGAAVRTHHPTKGPVHGSGTAGHHPGGTRGASRGPREQAGLRNPSHADRDGVPARTAVDADLRRSGSSGAGIGRILSPGAVSQEKDAEAPHARAGHPWRACRSAARNSSRSDPATSASGTLPVDRRPIFAVEATAFASLAEAHIGSYGVSRALERIQRALGLRSARTGAPINLAPRRFRSTLGTRAADVGHPPVLIAHLLDHTDLQHVGVYVESRGSIQDRMDAALHGRAEPLAGLFRGTVVADEVESGVGEAPSRRVAAAAGGGVGTCAGPRSCVRLAPLACYTCAAFRPWRDAPHEDLLQSLVEERSTLLADGVSPQVAGANDATIMAVAEVADRCRTMRTGAAHG